MISGISGLPGRRAVAACGVALALAVGPACAVAQSTQSPPNGDKNAAPPLVFKIKRQAQRGPAQPPSYPTQPQQEVRKLR
ncbi:hypothetical protein [Burkholderia stagnalis]|uniref:Uncharacterized protein n=1 Tax=Burkholderia stagnalis TaxID=1503054 RepID=A0A107ZHR1_9BURK|nr:hypothetical protein [Burkholderia stagnalis]KVL84701.1 hypothetical protein WT02_03430 [Burkholderia stagnalis]KVL90318.1 hypothetical protein WT03_20705 [Burkholderia stagnalis]KVM05091.1 hypothetical protein WT04_25535 [Burkholderia stagnalis]KVN00215.1 hypothetical protein WT07_19905 [Burkholderia stagnalis]KVN38188.1 hypothetical protein WT11_04455 [Burkholderia stagnalis]